VEASGTPYYAWLKLFSSHLARDEFNADVLNSSESGAATANCSQAAYNAYNGTNPASPISCPWGEEAPHFYLYDSQGEVATADPDQIDFSGVRRGDVVRHTSWWPPRPAHVETFSKDGVDEIWGCNTAASIPGVNWRHSSVKDWITNYKQTHDETQYPLLVKHYFR